MFIHFPPPPPQKAPPPLLENYGGIIQNSCFSLLFRKHFVACFGF